MPQPTLDQLAERLPKPVPVKQALDAPSEHVQVPDGATLTLGPFAERADSFRLAEVASFADLHLLGFVPEHVSEEAAVKAVRADDRLHRQALRQQVAATGPCSCGPDDDGAVPQIRRRHYQDHFLELLQPLHRASLTADDPAVVHPFRQVQAWLSRPARYLVGLVSLLDIDIGDRATLVMTSTVRGLYARNINIGNNGRLRLEGGSVHVRAAELNGPSRFRDAVVKYVVGLDRELLGSRP